MKEDHLLARMRMLENQIQAYSQVDHQSTPSINHCFTHATNAAATNAGLAYS